MRQRPKFGRGTLLAVVVAGLAGIATPAIPAHATDLRLWPLIRYHHEGDETAWSLLGPFVTYQRRGGARLFAIRPLGFWRRDANGNQTTAFLYPLTVVQRTPRRRLVRFLGLLSFDTSRLRRKGRVEWKRRFTLFPFVFYRVDPERGRSISVLPFYADLRDFFGYHRIRMVLFPAYLRLERALLTQTWVGFPFFSRIGGPSARGWRLWPLYGWKESGEGERFRYVLWPFYIRHERFVRQEEHEVRLVFAPWYAQISGPKLSSRAFLGPLLTHTRNLRAHTETWGFPWPFWMVQCDTRTGTRLTVRLAPFYQDRRQGALRSRFYLWPLFRTRTVEHPDHFWHRDDFGLVLGRRVVEVQAAAGHRRRIDALFPFWLAKDRDDHRSFAAPALFDAIVPLSETVAWLYAPLWQLYHWERRPDHPARWSLAWGLVSSDGKRLHGPVEWRTTSR